MLAELIDRNVKVYYSAVEGFTLTSKGTILAIEGDWLKLDVGTAKKGPRIEIIAVLRIMKLELLG